MSFHIMRTFEITNWFKKFVSSAKQKVKVKNIDSEFMSVDFNELGQQTKFYDSVQQFYTLDVLSFKHRQYIIFLTFTWDE
jgi:hypothetical protein